MCCALLLGRFGRVSINYDTTNASLDFWAINLKLACPVTFDEG